MKVIALLVVLALVSTGSFLVGSRSNQPGVRAASPVDERRVEVTPQGPPSSSARNADELAAELVDAAGLGPRLLELHRTNPQAALGVVQGACGLDSKSTFADGVLAGPEIDQAATGVTLIRATLSAIERAEMQQGDVLSDTRWKSSGAVNASTRRLVLRIDGVAVTIDQVRSGQAQVSTHSWKVSRFLGLIKRYGRGNDRLLPIADASGATAAYLLISHYKTDHESALSQLRKAMADWRRRAERLTQEKKK